MMEPKLLGIAAATRRYGVGRSSLYELDSLPAAEIRGPSIQSAAA
jgi:hypothetical protein